jgi:hypothetical protein
MSLGKKILLVFLPLFTLALAVAGLYAYMRRMPAPMTRQIIRPSWTQPVLVEPGDAFEIVLHCKGKPEVERVAINNTAAPAELEYKVKVDGVAFNEKTGRAVITVRAPKITPAAVYDLSVWFRDGSILLHDRQVNAVAVREARGDSFSFAVVSQFAFRADVDNPAQRRKKIRAVFEELNLMNPDFVVATGGISEGIWTGTDDAQTLHRLVEDHLQVPLFMLPNEDDTGRVALLGRTLRPANALWSRVAHDRRFRFRHRGVTFIGADTYSCADRARRVIARNDSAPGCISAAELKWVDKQLRTAARRKTPAVLFTHHSPARARWTSDQGLDVEVFEPQSQEKLLDLVRRHGAAAAFSGHVQRDTLERAAGASALFVTTGSGKGLTAADAPALRLVTVTRGVLDTDSISYVNKPASLPLGKVTASFRKPNDGKARANTITVNNGLKRPLENMALTAAMARREDNAPYEIKGGARAAQAYGVSSQFVMLTFDLEPGEKRVFEIK